MEVAAQFFPPAFNFHGLPATCDSHPGEPLSGFCASCLRERLTGLDGANARRSSSNSSALKSIYHLAAGGGDPPFSFSQHQNANNKDTATSHTSSSQIHELRRCKSLAGGKCAATAVEPRRKSCDARVRRTLWSLFHQDDRNRADAGGDRFRISSSIADTAVSSIPGIEKAQTVVMVESTGDVLSEKEIEDLRPMKDHIDLESRAKKVPPRALKEIAGSFWLAASLFSKKLKHWRKHKMNKRACNGIDNAPTVLHIAERNRSTKSSRQFGDAQSEIAGDAFGRRSCDVAPRFSLDAGPISLDDPGCSWDGHRASWDGYIINGSRSARSQLPAKFTVHSPPFFAVQCSDSLISVEDDSTAPGCSAQTREYYSNSSSRRRRSLDRSSSKPRHSMESCEINPASNSNIDEFFHWSNLEQDSKDWNSVAFRKDCSGSFGSACRNPILKAPPVKKSCQWNIWGFIHRHSQSRRRGPEMVERSLSETCPEGRENGHSGRILQGARRSFSNNGGLASSLNFGLETTVQKKKKSMELVLENSRSSRHSPSHFDNGLLRFYLTPLRGTWRRRISPKSKFGSPASFNSSILRLY